MKIKYALHPGYVYSKNDGDMHWITALQLARLYGVKMGECIDVAYVQRLNNQHAASLIHLYPDYNGNYKLPEES